MRGAPGHRCRRLAVALVTSAAGSLMVAGPAPAGPPAAPDDIAFFREQVEPLLARRCLGCHSHATERMESGLALDWRSGWEQGGDRGPAIRPGDPDGSLLVAAVRHTDPDLRMPLEPLPAA